MSGFSLRLHPKFYVLLMLFVLVCVLWCSTCIDYMSNLAGFLLDEGTAYPWETLAFTPVFGGVSVAHLFLCRALFFVFVFYSSCVYVPNIASVS